ncbi:uncharacterized protein LOC131842672 [Achroia grisella]|uniref:uncharacterized protein LOC131842672 n=1 Tax=Achroia grisella TaxID=688607 RepID=UPI0027D29516|nr:uncharacterized protein LOC131842672 [Achroia grisella]
MAPKVWSNFVAKKSDGTQVKVRIEDMPSNRLDEVLNLLSLYGENEDVFVKLLGIPNNPEAAEELKQTTRDMLSASPHNIVICRPDDDSNGDIIGVSITGITLAKDKLEDFKIPSKTKEMEKLWDYYIKLFGLYDICKANSLTSFSDDRGLAVKPGYVDFEIRKELLNVGRKISKANNVSTVFAWMQTKLAQEAAEADGWLTAYEISREDLGRQLGITISEGPPSWKLMYGKSI